MGKIYKNATELIEAATADLKKQTNKMLGE